MPSEGRYDERDPTYNPPNPDPDPVTEGTYLQDQLERETEAVLQQADRGWSVGVVVPKWWTLSDGVERLAGFLLFLLLLTGGVSQFLWAENAEFGWQVLTYFMAIGTTLLALWSLHTLLQRRVYGRRRSKAERSQAAKERVLKRWQMRSS